MSSLSSSSFRTINRGRAFTFPLKPDVLAGGVAATDWRPRTLEERKARAGERLANAPPGIQYREHVEGDGAVSGGTAKSAASIPDFSGLWRHLWPLWPRPDPVGQYEGLPLDAAEHRG